MSAIAASLPCPICAHTGGFDSAKSLRDRLIHISTNKILCPVCQEEFCGLDKLTIHLFRHVKLPTKIENNENPILNEQSHETEKSKCEYGLVAQQKKPRSVPKNKTTSSSATAPVKFVKIYPKLPVISLNPVPIIDITQRPIEECIQISKNINGKSESSLVQTNTTCNICGLQFVDNNILRMHRCLIHNIDESIHQSFTRYNCHLCPKHFKMRGSLMVHLRVAHYGFLSGNCNTNGNSEDSIEGATSQGLKDTPIIIDRNDNKQWQCDVCRKCFTTKYFLKKHKRLHTGETPYACTQCNKTFTFQQSYHKHLLYHNDEKPHTCSYCGRAFKELSTLHNHQRIHTGEKPFACETCGKCFRQRVSYLVHRRIHTGVMPYKCTACDKSFRYKVSQRTHKCQAQPPGTVVRQTGDLVEKLRKKHEDPDDESDKAQASSSQNIGFIEVSEANAELVRTGAKLSLEDMESENFDLLAGTFNTDSEQFNASCPSEITNIITSHQKCNQLFHTNIEELIDSMPIEDKSVPSPSEILKNLCLSKDEDLNKLDERRLGIFQDLNM